MKQQTAIGSYNRRVTVQRRSDGRSPTGDVSSTWVDGQTVWASIDIQYSALTYETTQFISKATYRIVLRWNKALGLRLEDRLKHIDSGTGTIHIYEIESIVNSSMMDREMLLLCYELDGDE